MIEMPLAILQIQDIAAAAADTRMSLFVMGTNDLAKELRASAKPDRQLAFGTSLSMAMLAARAYGIVAIDGVWNDISDADGFRSECEEGAAMGFDGKTLIHPSQLEICNYVFAPKPAEIEHSIEVIKAFADPENSGKGVLKVNGKMTELLHLAEAQRIVAMAEAIEAMEG